jgi:hypothetical protein
MFRGVMCDAKQRLRHPPDWVIGVTISLRFRGGVDDVLATRARIRRKRLARFLDIGWGRNKFSPSPERPFDGKHIERVVLSEIKNKILVSRFEMSADERMSE